MAVTSESNRPADEVQVNVAEVPFSTRGSSLNGSTVVAPHTSARNPHLPRAAIATALSTSFEQGQLVPPPAGPVPARIWAEVGAGPADAYTTPPGHGASGTRSARVTWDEAGAHVVVLLDAGVLITPDTWLEYCLCPGTGGDDDPFSSTNVSLDLRFDDGTTLSMLDVTDQNGVALTPSAQGGSGILQPRLWNFVECHLGAVAAGRVVTSVLVNAEATAPGTVWIDDVSISPRGDFRSADPVDLVDTRRGSNSSFDLSRGNTFPAAAIPNGATLVSPMTARRLDWFYSWAMHNTDSGRPALHGIVLSHQPSPWMGDRNQVVLAPMWVPDGTPARPHTFSHDAETARPYLYTVRLDGGPVVETAPVAHGAVVRLTVPPDCGEGTLRVSIGTVEGASSLRFDRTGAGTGWVESGSVLSVGRSRLFVAFTVEGATHQLATADDQQVLELSATAGDVVTVRVATSLLSVSQALGVLREELQHSTFDDVVHRAREAWARRLDVLVLDGASHDERVTAYSSLYRVNLYPTVLTETVDGRERYASPVLDHQGPSTDHATGAQVLDGPMVVNHGFWDTYRTVWPLYGLVYPAVAARLADGFVEQFRTGGWIARWSSPGYADLMTGTSSDVAFADLDAKGVPLPDRRGAYRAGLRNATALPTCPGVGRKDLAHVFLGGPTPEAHEPVSWASESALNDHALALMADRLARDPETTPRAARRYTDESHYLRIRSASYANLHDPTTGFFQSRHADGRFRHPPATYDPREWGGDYTEANGWSYAFPAPHDGAGLAGLVGGRERLRERLDTFFATPENGNLPGTYPPAMHEITEARLTRTGQFAVSNQPVHHIPFLYAFTSTPWRTALVVHDALRRLFRGSSIGQGYPGDEDNGEMSAWFLFAMTGLYPLQAGSPRYTIHAPYLPLIRWRLPGGDVVVRTRRSAPRDAHIQRVLVDGVEHPRSWIDHATLERGCEIVVELGPEPSTWGTDVDASPPSLTPWGDSPRPWRDLSGNGVITQSGTDLDVTPLVDNVARDIVRLRAGDELRWTGTGPSATEAVQAYTLMTASVPDGPLSWHLEASDGTGDDDWYIIDRREDEPFEWPDQIRPFVLDTPTRALKFRIVVDHCPATGLELRQLELLTH